MHFFQDTFEQIFLNVNKGMEWNSVQNNRMWHACNKELSSRENSWEKNPFSEEVVWFHANHRFYFELCTSD